MRDMDGFNLEHVLSFPGLLLQQLAGDVAAHIVGRQCDGGLVVGDHAAGVESDHPAGMALDDVHVVLDEQHRGVGLLA